MAPRRGHLALPLLLLACSGSAKLPPLSSVAGDMTWAGTKATLTPAAELQATAKGNTVAVDGVLPGSLCGQVTEPKFLRGEGVLALELVIAPGPPCAPPDSGLTFTATFRAVPPGSYTVWIVAPAEARQSAGAREAGVDTVRVGKVSL